MRLRKSLYGTPHAPANWHGTIVDFVITTGLKPLKSDPCLYIYNPTTKNGPTFATRNKGMVILTMHVDNRLPLGQNKVLLKHLGGKLVRRLGTMCMGDVLMVLGMQVARDRKKGTLTISQAHYSKSVREMYGMGECKPMYMIGVGPELSMNQGEGNLLTKADTQWYQSIVGVVMYLAHVSRYDILYGVHQLARAMSNPSKAHMRASKNVLRYFACAIDFVITYKKRGFKLTAFSDANWGNNPDNGKSTSSYVVMMRNGPVSVKVGT